MFVLVHGAGFGANCWDRLLPHLDRPAIAVDLPGRGSRAGIDLASVRLDDCARAILDDVAAAGEPTRTTSCSSDTRSQASRSPG